MLKLETTNRFEKDYVLVKKRGKDIKKLQNVVNNLLKGNSLPAKNKLHMLSGNWNGHYECHIEPDWLLIFLKTDTVIRLVRTGTHSDLL
jgi:mRNA interferase YafQ